jgi:cell wall-associated NlpC family hydrolase
VKLRFWVYLVFLGCCQLLVACGSSKKASKNEARSINPKAKVFTQLLDIDRKKFVSHAKTYLGTPYKYGSAIPSNGLDCSGFIVVVFANFNVKAPRVTKDFTNEGQTINLKNATAGDIILFTGSNHASGIVGHMGIITATNGTIQFIHSASGKNIGVIESKLTGYWKEHFVKVIRLLKT